MVLCTLGCLHWNPITNWMKWTTFQFVQSHTDCSLHPSSHPPPPPHLIVQCLSTRVRPFRLKIFKRIWIRFTCVSLFHYKISILFFRLFSLIFAYFRFKFFASLHFSNFCFKAKQSEAKFKSIFSLSFAFFTFFRYFSHFSLFLL